MGWFFKSGNAKAPADEPGAQQDKMDFLDPSLKEFYDRVKPSAEIESRVYTAGPTRTDRMATVEGSYEFEGGRTPKTIGQVARQNCAEFDVALSNCLVRGSMWDKFLSCQTQHMNQQRCVDVQEYMLKVLGFNLTNDVAQRDRIQARADDLLIQLAPTLTLTDETVDSVKKAVDQEGPMVR